MKIFHWDTLRKGVRDSDTIRHIKVQSLPVYYAVVYAPNVLKAKRFSKPLTKMNLIAGKKKAVSKVPGVI